jgi:uncharacterized NAD(P)/FAD-binding protein YdhS
VDPAPQRVLVIGTGLTAIDALLSASAQWPETQILAVSRHGRLPATHAPRTASACAVPDSLIAAITRSPRVHRWLTLIRAEAAANDWRAVIDSLRGATPALWQALDPAERRRFLRHVRWIWEIVRHRIAPQAAEAIELLRDSGQLRVIGGRILRVEGAAPLHAVVRRRDDGSVHTYAADLVIQAAGFERLTPATPDRLLRQMLDDGLIRADPLELGLEVDDHDRPLRADGTPWPHLHAIGALLRGTLWECTALREISAAAARLARELTRVPEPAHVPANARRDAVPGYKHIAFRQFGA